MTIDACVLTVCKMLIVTDVIQGMMTPDQRHRYQTRVSLMPRAVLIPWRTVSDQRHRTIGNLRLKGKLIPSKGWWYQIRDKGCQIRVNLITWINWYHPKDEDTRSETSVSDPSQPDTEHALIPPKDVTPQNKMAAERKRVRRSPPRVQHS